MSTQTNAKNPAAQALGRLGGVKNTPAQVKARARNAKFAGRPRRICVTCGEPVHGGHKDQRQNVRCAGTTWKWQKQSEKPGRRRKTP